MNLIRTFSLALASTMLLASCGSTSDVLECEKRLTKEGYSVQYKSDRDYGGPATGAEGFQYYLEAGKIYIDVSGEPSTELLFAWFFDNEEHAKAWWDAKSADAIKSVTVPEGAASGQHKQFCYVGTENAVIASQLSTL